jgi:uracil-DNA glycosylase
MEKIDVKIMHGIRSGWTDLMQLGVVEKIRKDFDTLSPDANLLFEAFRYFRPEHTKIVIIGQDPYPAAGDAMGLSFSTNCSKIPSSLKNIFACLRKSDILNDRDIVGDLKLWASQGVLLLNKSLSTIIGKSKAHEKIWSEHKFTENLITSLIKLHDRNETTLRFMLWGNDAISLERIIPKNHIVLKWTHPSPLADAQLSEAKKFKNCDHFSLTKDLMVWDLCPKTIVFTDGSFSAKKDDATFAVFYSVGPAEGTTIVGRVEPYKYTLRSDMCIGTEPDEISVTGNRAEYLAGIHGLYLALKIGLYGNIVLISDSKLFIKTMTEWYPKRKREGTTHEFKNLDLIEIAVAIVELLKKKNTQINFVHCHASHDAKSIPTEPDEKHIYDGNDKVDRMAKSHMKLTYDDDYDLYVDSQIAYFKV